MNSETKTASAAETACRIAEFRRIGWERKAMPHGVYQDPFIICPWADCDFRIAAVDFQLEKIGDRELHDRLLKAWWQGDGMVGKCPSCLQHVCFSMNEKRTVDDADDDEQLPDDWHQIAYIVG